MGYDTKKRAAASKGARARAGEAAEEQVRHYLNREFGSSPDFKVINDLRLEDAERPKADGTPDVCQIDHLVIHRRGMFIVESKSVHGTITVRPDGAGGDQWTRTVGRSTKGMDSPISQGVRQGVLLRRVLNDAHVELLGKMPIGLRTISRVVHQSEYRAFGHMPVQVIAAISETGIITREKGWQPPGEPFQHFLCKADQVTDKIRTECIRHRMAAKLHTPEDGGYGFWSMKADEVEKVCEFLIGCHRSRRPTKDAAQPVARATPPIVLPNPTASKRPNPTAACRHCDGVDLAAHWGRYGYYWKCVACEKNTSMLTVCSCCGEEGKNGKGVRIRKDGLRYYRVCEKCGIEERIWTAPVKADSH